jgi:hypothetical protein
LGKSEPSQVKKEAVLLNTSQVDMKKFIPLEAAERGEEDRGPESKVKENFEKNVQERGDLTNIKVIGALIPARVN